MREELGEQWLVLRPDRFQTQRNFLTRAMQVAQQCQLVCMGRSVAMMIAEPEDADFVSHLQQLFCGDRGIEAIACGGIERTGVVIERYIGPSLPVKSRMLARAEHEAAKEQQSCCWFACVSTLFGYHALRTYRKNQQGKIMSPKVGVLLSGCGFLDGTEIHEAVLTMLFLDRAGAEIVCIAPAGPQHHVMNHVTHKPVAKQQRDVLVESARIARGKVRDLATVQASELDAIVCPGGFGAVKNLCDFAVAGQAAVPHPEVARLLRDLHAQQKPIGAVCIAPALIACVLGKTCAPHLTIGNDLCGGGTFGNGCAASYVHGAAVLC